MVGLSSVLSLECPPPDIEWFTCDPKLLTKTSAKHFAPDAEIRFAPSLVMSRTIHCSYEQGIGLTQATVLDLKYSQDGPSRQSSR